MQKYISKHKTAREELKNKGYARLDDTFFGTGNVGLAEARNAFARTCQELPRDDHGDNENRCRRHGNFVLLPWLEMLAAVPPEWEADKGQFVSRYFQSSRINPEQGGAARSFAPLTDEQRENAFLRHVIFASFRLLGWEHKKQPIAVGVHIIQLLARPGAPAISSPDLVHRDGEPFTLAALVERHGIVGAENLITIPEVANLHPSAIEACAIVERFTLESAWHGWIVDDKKVAHYVSPAHVADGYDVGRRTILLVDFTPMVPDVER